MCAEIGIVIMMIGAMAGDSDNLLAPLSIIAIGALLIFLGEDRNE